MNRTALFVPLDRPRAVDKVRHLSTLPILDLEDAVAETNKDFARERLRIEFEEGFDGRLLGVRINGVGTSHFEADLAALFRAPIDFVVVPKVENAELPRLVAERTCHDVYAMIETAAGVLAAASIAREPAVQGLIVGTNDLAASLRLPPGRGRAALSHALQAIVLAARAAPNGPLEILDGVFNHLDDPEGLAAEAAEGRSFGFDGKTVIHPDQIAIVEAAFAPSGTDIEDARALVSAAQDGAQRFRGRMVETMHVAAARRLLREIGEGGNDADASL